MDHADLFSILKEIKFSEGAYLVGGTVRDMVIGRDPVDIDIAVSCDTERFATDLSKKIDGSLFPLDKERRVYRITVKKRKFPSCCFDISPIRGGDIYIDLSLRDFTVDAMAMSITDDSADIIDPYNGKSDIKGKCIRAISRKSFEDDPLRLLRAFRLASILDFEIDAETFDTIKEMHTYLRSSARERVRDEFFRLISSAKSVQYLKDMYSTGLLKEILIRLNDPEIEKGLIVFERLECLYNTLASVFCPDDSDIKKYLTNNVEDGITNALLWKWITLYDTPLNSPLLKGEKGGIKNMRLGNRARKLVLIAIKNMQAFSLDKDSSNKVPLYHFFKATGDDGMGLILCQIASLQEGEGTECYDSVLKKGRDAISWYLS